MLSSILMLAAALVLMLMCAVFVAAEFSLVTVNRAGVEKEANEGSKNAAGVLAALSTLSTQLSGVQIGITITNLAIGYLSQPAIGRLLEPVLTGAGMGEDAAGTASIVVAVLLATGGTMVLGELIPKNLAISAPRLTAGLVSNALRIWTRLVRGPIRACNALANAVLGAFGVEASEELASARSAEELGSLVRRSVSAGTMAAETAELVERSLAFGDRRARDVMTSRGMMVTLEHDEPVSEVLARAASTGHSRFPVVEHEEVVGVVYVRDALGVPHVERRGVLVSSVARPAAAVPDTVPLDTLLDVLRGGGQQLAMVVDEFGDTAGLVTLEDLVEELVGEVRDEHDEEEQDLSVGDDGRWVLPGTMRPDEAAVLLGVGVPEHEDYDTLGGLMTLELERFGDVGDVVEVDAVLGSSRSARRIRFTVLELDGHRIESIGVEVVAIDGEEGS